jgi:xanthine dehydrogenase molybdenum-binding subunit
MRGYGNPEVTFGIESNLDQLAEDAGIDPLDIRRINSNVPNELSPMGLKVTTCGLPECFEATDERLQWKERRGDRGAGTPNGKRRTGVGISSFVHVGGSGRIYRSDASGIILKLDDYGNINVYYGGVEMGQGLHSSLSLMLSDALGVKPESIFINQTDTGTCPWDVGTHASRGAFMAGNAAVRAATKLRARIFGYCEDVFAGLVKKRAPEGFEIPPLKADRFDLVDGVITCADLPAEPWASVELGRVLRAVHFREGGNMLTEEVFYDPPNELPDWKRGYGNMSASYTYGTQAVEVAVDEDTGEIEILRMVAATDVGKVLDPVALRGQMYGGIAQGVGYALYEQVKTEAGRILNPGFTDYKIPTATEMAFPIDLVFIETDDQAGPFGAKGVGEPGLVPTASAIANAVYDAIGIRIHDLPLTPEKVIAALAKKTEQAAR